MQPQDAAQYLRPHLEDCDREIFMVLLLDAANRVIGLHTVHVGTLMQSMASPRDTMKAALLANAASIILAHNHPSGDPTPSYEDRAVTEQMRKAGSLFDIFVADHIVIGENGRWESAR